MNSRTNWKALAIGALLYLSVAAAFAEEESKPVVVAAVPDASINPTQLTITGKHLGTAKPLVTLGSISLGVVGFTPTVVTALLPLGLKPGSYLLTLEPDGHSDKVARFDVALGVAGPKGDKGDSGPPGPVGAVGAQGPAGSP